MGKGKLAPYLSQLKRSQINNVLWISMEGDIDC